ncbi:MAG: universal stress protein [Chthoniobacteraceae bacterium]
MLHVVEPIHMTAAFGGEPIVLPERPAAFFRELKASLDKIARRECRGVARVSAHLREGVAYDEIVVAARKLKVDLIVIATHGRSGLMRALMGSTAERVARHAPCPVLVVPPGGGRGR